MLSKTEPGAKYVMLDDYIYTKFTVRENPRCSIRNQESTITRKEGGG